MKITNILFLSKVTRSIRTEATILWNPRKASLQILSRISLRKADRTIAKVQFGVKNVTMRASNIFCMSLLTVKNISAHRYLESNGDSIEGERTIDFYDSAQFDGLSRIEMGRLHLTEHYVDREDLLYYR